MSEPIPFYVPDISDLEFRYVAESLQAAKLSGDGSFTGKCRAWLESETGVTRALLTHSGTGALDLAALVLDLRPGDEVILPSYTFVSTANAFVLRGAIPVFVDSRPDTLNIDETQIEAAITDRTKAICVVHYAGVGCEMKVILELAQKHGLAVIEDAAQGLGAKYRGQALGAIGDLGALSFHDTKNVIAGEAGALLLKGSEHVLRAEILREKGTNRSQFFRGQVDKYTWVDMGSSFLPSELTAALLLAQLERSVQITRSRLDIWNRYYESFQELSDREAVGLARIPKECEHNGHIFYLLTRSLEERTALIAHLKEKNISAPFHYVPLHTSPAGRKYGRVAANSSKASANGLPVCEDTADRLVRLPLYTVSSAQQARALDVDRVVEAVIQFYKTL